MKPSCFTRRLYIHLQLRKSIALCPWSHFWHVIIFWLASSSYPKWSATWTCQSHIFARPGIDEGCLPLKNFSCKCSTCHLRSYIITLNGWNHLHSRFSWHFQSLPAIHTMVSILLSMAENRHNNTLAAANLTDHSHWSSKPWTGRHSPTSLAARGNDTSDWLLCTASDGGPCMSTHWLQKPVDVWFHLPPHIGFRCPFFGTIKPIRLNRLVVYECFQVSSTPGIRPYKGFFTIIGDIDGRNSAVF